MDTSGYGALLVPLLIEKFPFNLRQSIAKKFENDIWELPELPKILKGDLDVKERSIAVGSTDSETSPSRYSGLYSGFKSFSKKCVFCDENHYANRCVKITDLHARIRFLSSNGHCFICFEKSHVASSCKQNYKCNKCNGRHLISICTFSKRMNSPQTPQNGQSQNSQSAPATPHQDSSSNNSSTNRNNILKQTATASISNLEKNSVTTDVQVIFDSRSQRTYLNEALCERLKLPVIRSERIIVETFGNNEFQARDVNVVLIKFFTGYKNVFVEEICSPVICADLTNQNCKFVSKR